MSAGKYLYLWSKPSPFVSISGCSSPSNDKNNINAGNNDNLKCNENNDDNDDNKETGNKYSNDSNENDEDNNQDSTTSGNSANRKKIKKLPANMYIEKSMRYIQTLLDGEVFSMKQPFPRNFMQVIKHVFKLLFRIYAHIYYQHFPRMVALGDEAYLNSSFKHFVFFCQEFSLLSSKELAPMQELIAIFNKET